MGLLSNCRVRVLGQTESWRLIIGWVNKGAVNVIDGGDYVGEYIVFVEFSKTFQHSLREEFKKTRLFIHILWIRGGGRPMWIVIFFIILL